MPASGSCLDGFGLQQAEDLTQVVYVILLAVFLQFFSEFKEQLQLPAYAFLNYLSRKQYGNCLPFAKLRNFGGLGVQRYEFFNATSSCGTW